MKHYPLVSRSWFFVSVLVVLGLFFTTLASAQLSDLEAANKAVAQRFYDEVFTQKNMAVLDEVFDPNIVIHDLDVGGMLPGEGQTEALAVTFDSGVFQVKEGEVPGGGLPELLAAFPDVKATVNLWVTEGDLVTAYMTYNGTHQAEFLGVAATGKAITASIIDIWRVKDGKVVELWHNVPNEDILEQIQ